MAERAAAKGSKVALDGSFKDWPSNAAVQADPDWIYFHVTVPDASAPLQAGSETLALWLDADGDAKTGQVMPAPAGAAGMGVDLVVEYSPADAEHPGQTKRGVEARAMNPGGKTTALTHTQIGLASLPTYASGAYEARISRHVDAAAAPALANALAARGRGTAMFVLKDKNGKVTGWSDPESFSKPAMPAGAPVADIAVPAKPKGAVRVVSYNVLKSKLVQEPGTFARVLHALNPDVILLQEWDADAATATAWFTAVVTGKHEWYARSAAGDVVIVSPYEITALGGPDTIVAAGSEASEGGEKAPVRFLGAIVKTPRTPVAVGTLHLKCCGTAGSPEDARRLAEAKAINGAMRAALAQSGIKVRVFAGDFNLVGTRAPLDALCAGLDSDGSDLAVAEPMVLGDRAEYTWMDRQSEFPPGRLDFAVYSDAGSTVVNAFLLDTSRLAPKALAKIGLDGADTAASDHLPLVVDLKAK
jgi:endonuclease/exonuclease/phosphatase family metal-dependent hydrolase